MLAIVAQQGGQYWSEFRKYSDRVNSSQIAAVFHDSKYKSKGRVYRDLKEPDAINDFETVAMKFGKDKEKETLAHCVKLLKKKGVMASDQHCILVGSIPCDVAPICSSPDGVFELRKEDDKWRQPKQLCGIEVKTLYSSKLPSSPSEIPHDHVWQCFSAMHGVGCCRYYLYYRDYSLNKGIMFRFEPNPEAFVLMVEKVKEFLKESAEPKRKRAGEDPGKEIRDMILKNVYEIVD